jgi:signal transduction histidine kinase
MGPGVKVTTVLPLKETFREYVVEVVRELSPYFPDITARWRERINSEANLDARTLATLERITIACSAEYFAYRDFHGFLENLHYFGTRLAKLQVDTRFVHHALEVYEEMCEPYLSSLFPEDDVQAMTALEMASSVAFTCVSGAYFDTRTRENNCLLTILDVELAEMELAPMLQRVLEITCESFEAIVGSVLLREPDTDLLRVEATVGMDEQLRGEFSIELGQGFAGHIARSGEPEMIMDAKRDERILYPGLRVATAVWGVPLKYDNKTIGVIVIGFNKPYEWLPTERELLRAIADRSALAIHRARITQALRERETRIAELSAHLLRVQEDERKRISRELHDETGQGLMVIRLYLGMLARALKSKAAKGKVEETIEVVDRTVEGIRRIIGHLSPLSLQELGLFAAVRKEARDLELNRGIKTRVAIDDEVGRLGAETETAIYRIVQEALHNIAKHAHAQNATITMTREGANIRLAVEDDGVGIFPKSNFRGNSFGLAGIKERVGMLGGEVRVSSMKGKGTRVELTVPATEPTTTARLGLRPHYMDLNDVSEKGTNHAEDKMSTH